MNVSPVPEPHDERAHGPGKRLAGLARRCGIDRTKTAITASVLWAGFALVVWAVLTGRTGAFDSGGLLAARTGADHRLGGPGLLLETVRDMTALGGVFLRNLFALAAMTALLFLRLRREALLFAITVAGGWLVNTLLKGLVGRERPQIVPHLMEAGGESFPSGHSFNAAVVYIAIALAFAARSRRRSVSVTLVGTAMMLSAAVAWSRVILGVHFPSDVVAGWLGGAAWAFTAAALLHRPTDAAANGGMIADPGAISTARSERPATRR